MHYPTMFWNYLNVLMRLVPRSTLYNKKTFKLNIKFNYQNNVHTKVNYQNTNTYSIIELYIQCTLHLITEIPSIANLTTFTITNCIFVSYAPTSLFLKCNLLFDAWLWATIFILDGQKGFVDGVMRCWCLDVMHMPSTK